MPRAAGGGRGRPRPEPYKKFIPDQLILTPGCDSIPFLKRNLLEYGSLNDRFSEEGVETLLLRLSGMLRASLHPDASGNGRRVNAYEAALCDIVNICMLTSNPLITLHRFRESLQAFEEADTAIRKGLPIFNLGSIGAEANALRTEAAFIITLEGISRVYSDSLGKYSSGRPVHVPRLSAIRIMANALLESCGRGLVVSHNDGTEGPVGINDISERLAGIRKFLSGNMEFREGENATLALAIITDTSLHSACPFATLDAFHESYRTLGIIIGHLVNGMALRSDPSRREEVESTKRMIGSLRTIAGLEGIRQEASSAGGFTLAPLTEWGLMRLGRLASSHRSCRKHACDSSDSYSIAQQ